MKAGGNFGLAEQVGSGGRESSPLRPFWMKSMWKDFPGGKGDGGNGSKGERSNGCDRRGREREKKGLQIWRGRGQNTAGRRNKEVGKELGGGGGSELTGENGEPPLS